MELMYGLRKEEAEAKTEVESVKYAVYKPIRYREYVLCLVKNLSDSGWTAYDDFNYKGSQERICGAIGMWSAMASMRYFRRGLGRRR